MANGLHHLVLFKSHDPDLPSSVQKWANFVDSIFATLFYLPV
jgi:hypothetical protein